VATTTDLGKWMITNGGVYDPEAAYEQLTMVVYDNSTYITLKTVQGVTPIDDHVNYQLMAKGFDPTALGSVQAEDTSGVLGEVGGTVSAQDLVDWVVDQAATKLLKISDLVSVQTNDATKGVSAALAYAMEQKLDQLYSDKVTLQTGSYGSSSVPDSVKIEKAGVYLVYACGIAGSDSAYIHLYRNTVQIQGCQNTQGKSILAITVDNFAINDSVGFRWNNITESSGFRKSYGIVKL
jgi:hypothetical protein